MAQFDTLDHIMCQIKPGDLLEFNRGIYSHYAIYIGDGKVINVCAEDKNKVEAAVRELTLKEICGHSRVRIPNQKHDEVAEREFNVKPKSPAEIIKEAKSYAGRTVPYEFKRRNCEYYATLWRYGKGFSTQVANPSLNPGRTRKIRKFLDIASWIFLPETKLVSRFWRFIRAPLVYKNYKRLNAAPELK